ncbi:hypothetical protein B484DRAFT_414301 [Ochromonadaceae sp. CCMP2298]|nr:hypothetical protein B484DRAFT_414301 [Ochromonadaceae sp. CCMP2298]
MEKSPDPRLAGPVYGDLIPKEVIFSIIRSGRKWFTCIPELFHLHGDTLGQFFEIASFNICNGLIVINNIGQKLKELASS